MEAILKMQGVAGGEGAKGHLELVMWKQGYSVGGEDPLPYETPEGLAFMKYIMQGRIPPSVLTPERQKLMTSGELDVKILDKRGEEWVPPAVRIFKGASHSLGGASAPSATSAIVKDSDAAPAPPCDEAAPHTTVQLRLADGKRVPLKINLSRTVRDIQRVAAAAHATGGKAFILKAGFPPKTLENPSATVEEAALQGAAITQSLA